MEQALFFAFQHTANPDLLAIPYIARDRERPFILARTYPKYVKHLIETKSPLFFQVYPAIRDNWAILFNTAVRWDNLAVVKRILKDGRIDLEEHQKTCDLFDMTCRWQSYEVMKFFLNDPRIKIDPQIHSPSSLMMSIRHNRWDLFHELLRHPRIDIADTNQLAFRYTIYQNHLNYARKLLQDPRTDPTIWENDPLRHCQSCVRYLTGWEQRKTMEAMELLLQDPRVAALA